MYNKLIIKEAFRPQKKKDMNCETLIKKDIAVSCTDPLVSGIEPNAVIIARSDIEFGAVTFNATAKNVVETLTLKTGKRGYKVAMAGAKPFSGTKTAMVKGTYRNSWDNDFSIVVLDNGPGVCADIIDGLATGRYVVVYENNHKSLGKAETPGDSAFQVLGYYQGLTAETIENDKYSEETDGGWSVLLKETKSPVPALFLFKTSYTATKAIFDSLTADPVVQG